MISSNLYKVEQGIMARVVFQVMSIAAVLSNTDIDFSLKSDILKGSCTVRKEIIEYASRAVKKSLKFQFLFSNFTSLNICMDQHKMFS